MSLPTPRPSCPGRLATMLGALAALAIASLPAHAQPAGGQQPLPVWAQPKPPKEEPPPQETAPATSSVIARIGGRDITQAEFDQIAGPYYQQLKAQLGPAFDGEIERIAAFNVLDELFRRKLLAIEAGRQKVEITPAEVDAVLMQDPFFLTDGKFDRAKLESFKTSPGSNYLQLLPSLRAIAAMNRVDGALRRRFTPTAAQVRAEWARRNDRVRFSMLPLLRRDVSLEAEASEQEWEEYYRAHADQFMRKTRVRLRYARLPLPAADDTARAAGEASALARGRAIADSLREGTLPDSLALPLDTGLFEVPAPTVPGLGRLAGLADTLGMVDQDSTIRVVGPYVTTDAVIVGLLTERQARHVAPMREVLGDVRRRADAEKRRVTSEAERLAFYEANRDRWRQPRATLTRVTFGTASIRAKPPRAREVEAWYAQHGRSLFGLPDTSKAWMPPLTDSLRTLVEARLMEAQRQPRAARIMERIARDWGRGRDPQRVAKSNRAVLETLTFESGTADTLFHAALVDSLCTSAAATAGTIEGPRPFGSTWALWRVDSVDTTYVPPYEAVRAVSDQAFAEERREKELAEARAYFDEHQAEYLTPVRYALDYVAVQIPPVDSVNIAEAEVRGHYEANIASYRQEEQVRARHILFMTRGATPEVAREARARADSLRAAIPGDSAAFADLAKQFSQEPGAAVSGGDLGWFGRGRMVPEFETAAFALAPGEISPVVKTMFGYHIIRLEERKPEGLRPFEEVRDEIRRQLATARGDSLAQGSATALRRRLARGGDPSGLAAPHGGLVPAAPIAANEPLPGVGAVPGLAQKLPELKVGTWSPDVHRAGNRYLVLRVREQVAPRPAPFDEVSARAVEDMKNARRREAIERRAAAIREALAAGASLDSLAAPYGGLKDSGPLAAQAAFVPTLGSEPRVIERAFALKQGDAPDTVQIAQGLVWIRLEERMSGDPAALKAASPQLEAELLKERYDRWVEERKRAVGVEILRPDLKGPRPGSRS